MKKTLIFVFVISAFFTAKAQPPGSDIYLFNFRLDDDNFYISNAQNITNSPGYDNQPCFTPDGSAILFSSDDGFGQTDIFKYNLKARSERRLTYSPESEYSPIVTPDEQHISCIILKRDGEQRLWEYPKNGAIPSPVSKVDKVGYHTWLNDSTVYAFILGTPNTLDAILLASKELQKVASNPGVTLQKIPGTNQISFVDMNDKKNWVISAFDPDSKSIKPIIHTVNSKSEYYTWTPNGVLLSGDGSKLYKFNPKSDSDWVELADLTDYGIHNFTRLAINPDASLIAIVVTEE
ncbi:MAG: PD40 domain-containing protein [Cyclobacteriaceae bacterium]|nr:PD40 domain-containing protein [Cyclobacteriaceae bacterium]